MCLVLRKSTSRENATSLSFVVIFLPKKKPVTIKKNGTAEFNRKDINGGTVVFVIV